MRIKVDVWSKGINESVRVEIRENLRTLFCQLPARRLWFYLKLIRQMLLGKDEALVGNVDIIEGPENTIVRGTLL